MSTHPIPSPAPRRRPLRRTGAGVSLVELMVAVAVGAIVLLGLAEILASTSATYTREEEFARLQEHGRLAAMMVAKEMRPNRSTDCKSIALHQASGSLEVKARDLLADPASGAHYLEIDRPLGFDNNDPGRDLATAGGYDLPSDAATDVANRWALGDVLVTWGVAPDSTPLEGHIGGGEEPSPDGTGNIELASEPANLHPNDLALVSNCQYAHVFEVTGPDPIGSSIEHAAGDDTNTTSNLRINALYDGSAPYNREPGDPRARLYPLVYKVFYICCVSNDDERSLQTTAAGAAACRPGHPSYDPDGFRPALCSYDIQRDEDIRNQPLVPNVADMRVTYSGDSNADGALDFRADDTGDDLPTAQWVSAKGAWAGVRSATVELLVTTGTDGSAESTRPPARGDWPPNEEDGEDGEDSKDVHPDTLGASYPEDRRLYQRFRFEVALRPSTLWTVKD